MCDLFQTIRFHFRKGWKIGIQNFFVSCATLAKLCHLFLNKYAVFRDHFSSFNEEDFYIF